MVRTCTVCRHPEHEAINAALVIGRPHAEVAAAHGLGYFAIRRHHRAHLPAAMVKAEAAREVTRADDLLGQVHQLREKALALLEKAEAAGDHRGAQEQLEPAVNQNPEHVPARFQLAYVLAVRRKYAAAAEHLKTVLRLAPEYTEARYNLGLCYHYMGLDEEAVKTFEEAVQKEPDYPWNYYGLGLACEAQKKNRLAQEAMTMALEKDPSFLPAQQALKRLRGETAGPKLAWPWGLLCGEKAADAGGPPLPAAITLAGIFLPGLASKTLRRKNSRNKK